MLRQHLDEQEQQQHQQNKDHMWASIKDKFDAEYIEQKRDSILRHLHDLWNKWCGDMHRKYVKENLLQVAFKNKPADVDDWDWLVKEHYFLQNFRKMLHHTGSKPFRQIAWDLGGKSENPPYVAKMFYKTQKKADETLDTGDQDKYDEIVQVKQANHSLSDIKVVEKIWGEATYGHITVFDGGTTL
ncbi:uncharacterized protein LOC109835956 isoform X2 [Asparagus officinalis]|uniref:uncharacterized protein LOC109835956 isoform X2 n=1 Tax=Asparagus officinalis TaxID=4686 RepID=UPI00098E33A0|nr:uncharacterized protein LOC109835956 isoform X2 [Asparagus officinalis]